MGIRGLTPVVGIALLVLITVIISSSIGVFVFDFTNVLTEPAEPRAFGETEVVLGSEHRTWYENEDDAWNASSDGETPRGDIDKIIVPYNQGDSFLGNETGAIEVSWSDGSVRFLNPGRFDSQTEQKYHDAAVGEFCTGNFHVGETLTIRMVHNSWQDGGETDPDKDNPEASGDFGIRYAESSWNDISTSANKPFFRTENRYPIEYSGTDIIKPGDEVTVTFYGPEGKLIVAETTGTARLAGGDPTRFEIPSC